MRTESSHFKFCRYNMQRLGLLLVVAMHAAVAVSPVSTDRTPTTPASPVRPVCDKVCEPGYRCELVSPPCPSGRLCPAVLVPTCVPVKAPPRVKPGRCPVVPPGQEGICVELCSGDESCPGDQKCCSNGCGHVCTNPVRPITCANVQCLENTRCVQTPEGPRCEPLPNLEKPGICPPQPPCAPPEPGYVCTPKCRSDRDCPGAQKCCPSCPCGGCVDPVPSCSTTKCPKGTRCVQELFTVRCEPIKKPGECPIFQCPALPYPPTCVDSCRDDSECKGTDKCCQGCSGCKQCLASSQPLTCANILCDVGTDCVERPEGPRCEPVPVDKPGKCPVVDCPFRRLGRPCLGERCSNDSQCDGNKKCCQGCNGCQTCTTPEPDSCRNFPCPSGHRCDDTPIFCFTEPCPQVRCIPIEPCSLPKDSGPCEAAITRYYFDPTLGCQTFIYGGCKGNSNNFQTLSECLRACATIVG